MNKIKEFLISHPELTVIPLLAAICLGVGFMVGRASIKPEIQVVEKQVIVEKEVLKVVEVEKTIVEKHFDSSFNKKIHYEKTEEIKADGTKLTKETRDENVDKVVKDVEVRFVDRTTTVDRIVEKKIEVEKIVKVSTPLPDWSVAAKVGVSINNLLNPTLGSPMVVGAEVDRRILGPFKTGAWVNTVTTFNQWSVGVSLIGEF